jgi:hypothetical protein
MRVNELVEKQPEQIQRRLQEFKEMRNIDSRRAEARHRAGAYTQALCDAGIITDKERQQLFIYTTL